jgi:hypothetical protein
MPFVHTHTCQVLYFQRYKLQTCTCYQYENILELRSAYINSVHSYSSTIHEPKFWSSGLWHRALTLPPSSEWGSLFLRNADIHLPNYMVSSFPCSFTDAFQYREYNASGGTTDEWRIEKDVMAWSGYNPGICRGTKENHEKLKSL